MEISLNNKKIIIQDAQKSYPNECCGLLVDVDNELVAIPCNNISETPEKSFIIDPLQIKLYDLNKIKGFYHSHKNNPEFSLADITFSEKLKKYCILYITDSDIFKTYEPNGFLIPYVGRPMFGGFIDCVSLFQDYYKKELNIILKDDITHPLRYDHKSWTERKEEMIQLYGHVDILEEYLIKNDFKKVDTIKKYDVLLLQMPNLWIPSHIAILIEKDQILHHFYEFSDISPYSNAFKRLTVKKYRHPSLI